MPNYYQLTGKLRSKEGRTAGLLARTAVVAGFNVVSSPAESNSAADLGPSPNIDEKSSQEAQIVPSSEKAGGRGVPGVTSYHCTSVRSLKQRDTYLSLLGSEAFGK